MKSSFKNLNNKNYVQSTPARLIRHESNLPNNLQSEKSTGPPLPRNTVGQLPISQPVILTLLGQNETSTQPHVYWYWLMFVYNNFQTIVIKSSPIGWETAQSGNIAVENYQWMLRELFRRAKNKSQPEMSKQAFYWSTTSSHYLCI